MNQLMKRKLPNCARTILLLFDIVIRFSCNNHPPRFEPSQKQSCVKLDEKNKKKSAPAAAQWTDDFPFNWRHGQTKERVTWSHCQFFQEERRMKRLLWLANQQRQTKLACSTILLFWGIYMKTVNSFVFWDIGSWWKDFSLHGWLELLKLGFSVELYIEN